MFDQTFKNIDVIRATPPFGGKERKAVQLSFPVKTGELMSSEAEAAIEEATV